MKPILVHLHIYYKELYPELKEYLKNIKGYDFRLVVTMVEDLTEVIDDVKKSFDNVQVKVLDNLGYDIGPFVEVINSVNLDDYSYVVKLHTKRDVKTDLNNEWFSGTGWRNTMLSFIKSQDRFDKVIARLESDNTIGMHGAIPAIFSKDDDLATKTREDVIALAQKNNLKAIDYEFLAGSVFVVRASVLKMIQALKLSQKDFEIPDETHVKSQFAHIIERYLGFITYTQGMTVEDCELSSTQKKFFYLKKSWLKFFNKYIYSVRVTKKRKLLVKILRIPVYSRKF